MKIAPFSWLAQHDLDDAREVFNFSEWNGPLTTEGLQNAINDNMPPLQFTLLHPNAKLSDADKQTLVEGFQASLTDNNTSSPPASDATAIIDARCGTCHSAGTAQQFHAASADEAQALIDQMAQKGASLKTAEEQALIAYFTR